MGVGEGVGGTVAEAGGGVGGRVAVREGGVGDAVSVGRATGAARVGAT